MHCLDLPGIGRSVKVHYCPRWRETLEPSGGGGTEKEGESGSAQTRAVGQGMGNYLEERRGNEDMAWREAGGTSGHVGKSNVTELQTG